MENNELVQICLIYNTKRNIYDFDYINNELSEYKDKISATYIISDKLDFNVHNYFDIIIISSSEFYLLPKLIESNKKLKWVHSLWAGVENALAHKEIFKLKGIKFTNGKGAFKIALAEYSIQSMLYFSYRIKEYEKYFEKREYIQHVNRSIDSKTLTIVGYGLNGQEIAKKAKLAFNMNIIGIKKSLNDSSDMTYLSKLDTIQNLNDYLPQSDFVIAVLPSTEETKDLFNLERFSLMKKSSIFINIGRGSTVNENDLIKVLKEKRIAGAALDVFKNEPLDSSSEFYDLDNVLLSFHSADNTDDNINNAFSVFKKNLRNFLSKEELVTIVDFYKGY